MPSPKFKLVSRGNPKDSAEYKVNSFAIRRFSDKTIRYSFAIEVSGEYATDMIVSTKTGYILSTFKRHSLPFNRQLKAIIDHDTRNPGAIDKAIMTIVLDTYLKRGDKNE